LIGANKLWEKAFQVECAGEEKNTETFDLLFNKVKVVCNKLMLFLFKVNWMEIPKEHDFNKQQAG
jgi:hypothetical protein